MLNNAFQMNLINNENFMANERYYQNSMRTQEQTMRMIGDKSKRELDETENENALISKKTAAMNDKIKALQRQKALKAAMLQQQQMLEELQMEVINM